MKYKFYDKKEVIIEPKRFGDRKFNGSVFTTAMDPTSQATKYPVEYPIIAASKNRMVDVKYTGPETDGDNTAAVATYLRSGPLYRNYDTAIIPMQFKYLGLAFDDSDLNAQYNRELASKQITALSAAYATQLTELAYLTSTYKTDIPGMTEGNAAKFGAAIFYQTVNLNIAQILQAYNTLLSYSDYLVNLGYNAESSETLALVNLCKKAVFRSVMARLGVRLRESYVDADWLKSVGAIANVPCRDFDDVLSPLISVLGWHRVPNIKIKKGTEVVFNTFEPVDEHDDPVTDGWNNITVDLHLGPQAVEHHKFTFEGLVVSILQDLNVVNILDFARDRYAGREGAFTPMFYFNYLHAKVEALISAIEKFDKAFVDFTTFLMVLQDTTQLNSWVIGSQVTSPETPRMQIEHPVDYMLVRDIMRAAYSGGSKMTLDKNTRKWVATCLWDYEAGVPAFDYYEGGLSITSSVRTIENAGSGQIYTPYYVFPVLFTIEPTITRYGDSDSASGTATPYTYRMAIGSRTGNAAVVRRTEHNASSISASPTLARLNLLDDSVNVDMWLPDFDATTLTGQVLTNVDVSNIVRVALKLFGVVGTIKYKTMGANDTVETVEKELNLVSPSVVGIVKRQFQSYADTALKYLDSKAPFRTKENAADVGFALSGGVNTIGERKYRR